MSIVTKTGDNGSTGLMYNRRVSKCNPRVEAFGAVDELNAALGLARASARHAFVSDRLLPMQKAAGQGWATPGSNLSAATLDVARTTCRSAERRVCAL